MANAYLPKTVNYVYYCVLCVQRLLLVTELELYYATIYPVQKSRLAGMCAGNRL